MNIPYFDKFTNKLPPMYPLMLSYLLLLFVSSVILSVLKILAFDPLNLLFTAVYIDLICYLTNNLFAKLFKIKSNTHSQHITALILTLIIGPFSLLSNLLFATAVSILAMASKYVLVYHKKHIFNPAGFGVLITAILIHQGASWWAGGTVMLPVIIILGLIVVYKIKRLHLVVSFLITYTVVLLLLNLLQTPHPSFIELLQTTFSSSLLFFTFVMLIEPKTSPSIPKERMYYGIFTAIILAMYQTFLTNISYTLELSLLTGNLFTKFLFQYQLRKPPSPPQTT